MNKIPFTEQTEFPLDSTTLDALQNLSREELHNAIVAIIGSPNCILAGVTETESYNYSAGVVIINGEILQFLASTGRYLTIVEERDKVAVDGVEHDVLIRRYAQAGDSGIRIIDLKVINMAGKLDIPRINYGLLLTNPNAHVPIREGWFYAEATEGGYCVIQGFVNVGFIEFNKAQWVTIHQLGSKFAPKAPRRPVYFKAFATDGNERSWGVGDIYNELYCRVSIDGELQVYYEGENLNGFEINVNYYNPEN